MSEAYKMLPHLCMAICYAIKKRNVFDIIAVVAGSITLLSFGTRGAVVTFILFTAVYLLFFCEFKHKILIYTLFFCVVAVILIFSGVIYEWLYETILESGMSTRVLDTFSRGDFWQSQGRDNIHRDVLEQIKQKPLFGYGIGGDRTYIGIYAHNILFELWASFGVVAGSAVFAGMLFIIYKGIKAAGTPTVRTFILLLSCCAFFKLFMSSSFLQEPKFFMLMGLCVSVARRQSIIKNNKYKLFLQRTKK